MTKKEIMFSEDSCYYAIISNSEHVHINIKCQQTICRFTVAVKVTKVTQIITKCCLLFCHIYGFVCLGLTNTGPETSK